MIIDSLLNFGSATLSSGDGACADIADTKAAGDALGDELYFHVKTGATAPAGGTSLIVKLQTCAVSAFSSGVVDLITTPSVALASLPANKFIYSGRIPAGSLRYLRAYVDVTGTFTAGAVECFITHGPQLGSETL